jgi:acetolactate synthase small subunit
MFAADSKSPPTYCFSVLAAPDASVMPRVLGLFAKRGLVPTRFHADVVGPELAVDIQVRGLSAEVAEHVANALRAIVPVERVLTAVKREAREVSA